MIKRLKSNDIKKVTETVLSLTAIQTFNKSVQKGNPIPKYHTLLFRPRTNN